MDVSDLRGRLVEDYARYTRSFIKIADERIKARVDGALDGGQLWPEPLLQPNPTFLPGGTIEELVKDGTLHDECRRIFRVDKTTAVSFRCTPEFRLRLAAAAAHEHRSQANFLKRLLEEYCERTGLSVNARRPRAV